MTILYAGNFEDYSALVVDTVALVGGVNGALTEERHESKVFSLHSERTYASLVGDALFRNALMVLDTWIHRAGKTLLLVQQAEIEALLAVVRCCYEVFQAGGLDMEKYLMETRLYVVSPVGVAYWEFLEAGTAELYRCKPPGRQELKFDEAVVNYGGNLSFQENAFVGEGRALTTIVEQLEALNFRRRCNGEGLPYQPAGRYSGVFVPKDSRPAYPVQTKGLQINPFEAGLDVNVRGLLDDDLVKGVLSRLGI